jgi:hypothetical protein
MRVKGRGIKPSGHRQFGIRVLAFKPRSTSDTRPYVCHFTLHISSIHPPNGYNPTLKQIFISHTYYRSSKVDHVPTGVLIANYHYGRVVYWLKRGVRGGMYADPIESSKWVIEEAHLSTGARSYRQT